MKLAIPLILAAISAALLLSRKPLFDSYLAGAREGLETAIRLLPALAALLTATSLFSASGAAEYLAELLSPVCEALGLPSGLIPFLVVRPVSGGAATAMLDSLLKEYGPDSFTGMCASVIAGSSDTIIYVVAVYFSAAGVKRTRHALPAAFLTMLFCVFLSCAAVRIFSH